MKLLGLLTWTSPELRLELVLMLLSRWEAEELCEDRVLVITQLCAELSTVTASLLARDSLMKLAICRCAFSEMWMFWPELGDFSTDTLTSFSVGSGVLVRHEFAAAAVVVLVSTLALRPILFSENTSPKK